MKAIMISIKPKYVAKILNGEKTIEVRKSIPKCDLPIDVYVYCTKDFFIHESKGKMFPVKHISYSNEVGFLPKRLENIDHPLYYDLRGKVVAKFTLNKVEEINTTIIPNLELELEEDEKYRFAKKTKLTDSLLATDFLKMSCLSIDDLNDYFVKWEYDELSGEELNISNGYAWHISNLEVFDEPKELSEFNKPEPFLFDGCWECPHVLCDDSAGYSIESCELDKCEKLRLTKAPQSYMFIEID